MIHNELINIARGNGKRTFPYEQIFQHCLKLPGHPEISVTVDSQDNMVHMSLDFYGYDDYATFANFCYTNGGTEAKLEVDHHLHYNYCCYSLNAVPDINQVIFNDPATIVLWEDNTKTVVKCQEDDIYDPEKGLYACIVKKALGNKSNFNNVINKWVEKYIPKKEGNTSEWIIVQDGCHQDLKDHYWYLILDPRFLTPMKGKWHDDTDNFTYQYNGRILDSIPLNEVKAFKPLGSYYEILGKISNSLLGRFRGDEVNV